MPNYDFQKDKFHIFFSNGDDLAHLDRESLQRAFHGAVGGTQCRRSGDAR